MPPKNYYAAHKNQRAKDRVQEMQKSARKKREQAKALEKTLKTMTEGAEKKSAFTPAIDAFKKITGGIGDFARGIKNDVSMGFNPETRDQDYYRRTMDTINRTRGLEAAQAYYDQMPRDRFGNIRGFSAPTEQLAPRIGGHPGGSISGGGYVSTEVGDDTGPVDDDGNPVDDDGNPIEEEIEYTYMPPFFGGYQPATREDTLVPERGGLGSFLPNPRLDPIFPQQPPPDFEVHPGLPGYGKTYPPGYDGRPVPAGDLMNDPNYRGDGTNFGMIENNSYRPGPEDFYRQNGNNAGLSMVDANGNPLMNRDMIAQGGVASLFGNEQAPPYMYQGIMS